MGCCSAPNCCNKTSAGYRLFQFPSDICRRAICLQNCRRDNWNPTSTARLCENLKKSWHPSTMRNMEKVWKAEQKHDQEKKRIAELQREIREEREREDIQKHAEEQGVIEKKNEMKLEWMYKGPGGIVDREEYLLGRAIDKTFEQLQESEKPSTSSKGVLDRSGMPVSNEQVDLARKLQEDPLFVIKKKELESRTQILKNPMKVKKLQKLLKVQKPEKERKHKKSKKKKKRRHGSSSSENSESEDLDALLAAKYIRLKNKLHDMDLEKLKKSEVNDSKRKKKYSDDDSDDERQSRKKYGLQRMGEKKPVHMTASRNNTPRETPNTKPPQKHCVKPERKKLTEEEMERRRQEMMQFAKERDEERKNNVARYKAQDELEKKRNKGGYSEDFMRKQLSKAAAMGTVESRIKSNINNIQRSHSDMDTNFARR